MPPRYSPSDEPDKLDSDPVEAASTPPAKSQQPAAKEDPDQPKAPPSE